MVLKESPLQRLYPWRGQCGGKIQGQSTCSADDDDGFKDICTHSPLQLHLGSIFISASGTERPTGCCEKNERSSDEHPYTKKISSHFDTGIKVRFLCLRFQVIFVNGSL